MAFSSDRLALFFFSMDLGEVCEGGWKNLREDLGGRFGVGGWDMGSEREEGREGRGLCFANLQHRRRGGFLANNMMVFSRV